MNEVRIKSDVTLAGTLSLPEDNNTDTAVVMIPGSGKIDRDGNIEQKGMDFNLYKDISDFIVSLGFITFRYDKRGVGESEGDHLKTGLHDSIKDVQAAIQYIRTDLPVVKKIILLGHSEGTMIATAVAARGDADGVILLAGGGETLEEASKRQRELYFEATKAKRNISGWLFRTFRLDEKTEKKNEKLFEKIKATDKDMIRVQLMPFPAKWLREHFMYDLLADFQKITCPVLAVTGKVDFQSDYRKLNRLNELISSELETYVIDDMDHMLKKETEDINILRFKQAYQRNRSKPIHPRLKEILEGWLH
ncbi:hypothetical protein SAMN04487944_101582 [Gracilibacillus ureilyticus]|uniref:Serine aminopeptidase S33 domain-containing protein n=1 Tax=Gracilibacillus ureilyticus TaxID=531814 RepID=A0A1H9M6Y0_9BACI|nr:alpha/beta fold hydrolase [Gracilibacillus ureilyticus]SER19331.1 hypothetical protein SAMN04487944_101582 [Gracilibacillus ureilyticus]